MTHRFEQAPGDRYRVCTCGALPMDPVHGNSAGVHRDVRLIVRAFELMGIRALVDVNDQGTRDGQAPTG